MSWTYLAGLRLVSPFIWGKLPDLLQKSASCGICIALFLYIHHNIFKDPEGKKSSLSGLEEPAFLSALLAIVFLLDYHQAASTTYVLTFYTIALSYAILSVVFSSFTKSLDKVSIAIASLTIPLYGYILWNNEASSQSNLVILFAALVFLHSFFYYLRQRKKRMGIFGVRFCWHDHSASYFGPYLFSLELAFADFGHCCLYFGPSRLDIPQIQSRIQVSRNFISL